jgi:hypothetical protein
MHVADDIQRLHIICKPQRHIITMHIVQYIWSELQKGNESSVNGDKASITTTRPTGGHQNAELVETTTATLVVQESGCDVLEFNASKSVSRRQYKKRWMTSQDHIQMNLSIEWQIYN